jgi:hypothetical protein
MDLAAVVTTRLRRARSMVRRWARKPRPPLRRVGAPALMTGLAPVLLCGLGVQVAFGQVGGLRIGPVVIGLVLVIASAVVLSYDVIWLARPVEPRPVRRLELPRPGWERRRQTQ